MENFGLQNVSQDRLKKWFLAENILLIDVIYEIYVRN